MNQLFTTVRYNCRLAPVILNENKLDIEDWPFCLGFSPNYTRIYHIDLFLLFVKSNTNPPIAFGFTNDLVKRVEFINSSTIKIGDTDVAIHKFKSIQTGLHFYFYRATLVNDRNYFVYQHEIHIDMNHQISESKKSIEFFIRFFNLISDPFYSY
jgi:hypothetical protein